jgi:hypothetical protein
VTEGWLTTAHAALTRRINDTIDNYDNAKLTLDDAKLFVRNILKSALDQVYTQGYNDGLENAELDGDYEDDEEIELVDDDEEGDEDDA